MTPRWLTLTLLALATAWVLRAQTAYDRARPALRTFGMEAGLPSGTIYCFTFDAKGRLWAGTIDGAAYYTGGGWVPVRLPKESASQYVRSLLSTADGSLWFGTQDGGVWCLKDGKWTHLRGGRELPSDHVFTLAETRDAQGRPIQWVGTAEGGIAACSGGTWRTWDGRDGLSGGTVWRIRDIHSPDGTRAIWAATETGLLKLNGERWHRLGAREGFPEGDTNDVLDVPGRDGHWTVWVSLWDKGLARWNGQDWKLYASGGAFPGHSPTSSFCLTKDPTGASVLWIGTLNQGLWWYQDGRWRSLEKGEDLATTGVLSLQAVPEGKPTLLVGTRGGGVASLDLGGWRTLDERQGLPGPEVTCFAETPDTRGGSTFWIGTSTGLAGIRPGHPVERVKSGQLPSEYLICLLPSGGRLWAGTLKGLAWMDRTGWHRPEGLGRLRDAMVICLLETKDRSGHPTLWMGTPWGLGQFREGHWRVFTTRDGLPQNYVSALCAVPGSDGDTDLWIGTRGGGVARLRGETWTRFGGSTGIPNWTVYALCEATGSDGHPWLWAGSLGSGIARLDLRNPVRWEVFTRDNLPGLTSNYVQRIERDREGRLYLSTSRGVVRFHAEGRVGAPTLGRVDSYTIGDGLPSMNGSLGASFLDAAGRIWIGTARGAAVLDPTLETLPGPPPAPVLEGATVDDSKRAVALGQRLGYRDSHLRFEFSLPVFHRKEDTRYQTQLVGLEAEPRPWQPEGWRDFATLPPGAYVLKVWGRTYDGRVSGPLVFPFSVAPPPWAHPAAYLLYALGVVGGALGLYRLRTRVLRERTLALEVAVNDRTRTIEHQSLQLEASNRALQGRNVELRETNDRNEQLIRELSSALAEVKTLQGLIPICSYCKKIRDDAGLWAQMEHYITEHSGAQFSHGICPECHGRFFSETQDPKPS